MQIIFHETEVYLSHFHLLTSSYLPKYIQNNNKTYKINAIDEMPLKSFPHAEPFITAHTNNIICGICQIQ